MRRPLLLAFALVLAGAGIGRAQAMTFERGRTEDGRPTLVLQGRIVPGDAGKLQAALRGAPANVLFVLNSPGGAVLDGRDMGRIIRARGGAVLVPGRAVCASACFLLFAGGTDRRAEPGAMIGVHSASVSGGGENTGTLGTTTLMAREAGAYGVPPAITGRMVTTKPGDMAWLSRDELESMGARIAARAGGSGTEVQPGSPGGAPSDWTAGFEAGRSRQACAVAGRSEDWRLGCRSGERSAGAGVAASSGGGGASAWSQGFDAGRSGGGCEAAPAGVGVSGEWLAGCRSGRRAAGGE